MSNNNELILVVGGTGKTGKHVVEQLKAKGHNVRVGSRSTTPRLDLHDPLTWAEALEGVTAAYIAPPDIPFADKEFVASLVNSGVRRIVTLSGRRIQKLDPESQTSMARTEKSVRESGVEWTVLQANNFNQNFTEGDYADAVKAGRHSLPLGDTREPLIDAEDIAEVAAVTLTTDGHAGKVYELTGPQSLTQGEAMAAIAEATGKPVVYHAADPAEHAAELSQAGLPDEVVAFLNAMYEFMRTGAIADTTDHVRQVLGRDPIDFATWAKRAAEAGAWS
ncbi:NmrA family NAD(P)-binding protein [Stackebrandtia nassauensis]|uniref:NmrA family protein n=1 Tax=Stackebrandtia nassauensis (strain DSM 44728 / CIP 108903 / NRRL B-16338 / NBRC 102104 / LLR-40K-21) TaxID=446470 RepID=D3Q2Q9_STANL|nr:NmrA family NAD(P)-binding protein [Stackebrandtia nassauensis]ADD45810.1 NmrA family protein [Stackebrandtia nassauensis DSM 44728]